DLVALLRDVHAELEGDLLPPGELARGRGRVARQRGRRLAGEEGGPGLLADDAVGLELPVALELADGLVGAAAEVPVGPGGPDVVAQLLEPVLHLLDLCALAPPLQQRAGGRRRPRAPGDRRAVQRAEGCVRRPGPDLVALLHDVLAELEVPPLRSSDLARGRGRVARQRGRRLAGEEGGPGLLAD